jgi:hypothetical protein
MVTRLRAGRLENRGSIPDRKDDLSRFYSREPCHGSGQAVYVIPVGNKVALGQAFFLQYFHFPLSVSFHQRFIVIFIYMLLYQKDKRVKPGKHVGNLRAWASISTKSLK